MLIIGTETQGRSLELLFLDQLLIWYYYYQLFKLWFSHMKLN